MARTPAPPAPVTRTIAQWIEDPHDPSVQSLPRLAPPTAQLHALLAAEPPRAGPPLPAPAGLRLPPL